MPVSLLQGSWTAGYATPSPGKELTFRSLGSILSHLQCPTEFRGSSEASASQPDGERNANERDLEERRPHGSVWCNGVDNVYGKCEDCANTGIVRMRRGFRCRIGQHNYCTQRKTETSIDPEVVHFDLHN